MWFKQVTCDNCFNLLESTGRHNCYIMFRILKSKIIPSKNDYSGSAPYINEYPIVFASFNSYKTEGNSFMYSVNQEDMNMNYRTWFCCNECAYNHSIKTKTIMLYYDEKLDSVRAITPHMVQTNRELEVNDYKGLFFSSGNFDWIIAKSEYKTLRKYNKTDNIGISTPRLILTGISESDCSHYINLLNEKGFQNSFFGVSLNVYTYSRFRKHFELMQLNMNRRLGLEWNLRIKNAFIGFIRLNSTYLHDPHNWYLEFGIMKKHQRKGLMKEALLAVLNWSKLNGLENIYAISEIDNKACYNLLKKLPNYTIDIQVLDANDKYAGNRNIYRYSIKLIAH